MLSRHFHGGRCQSLAELAAAHDDLVHHLDAGDASCSRKVSPRVASSVINVVAVVAKASRMVSPLAAMSCTMAAPVSTICSRMSMARAENSPVICSLVADSLSVISVPRWAKLSSRDFAVLLECLANVGALLRQSVDDAAAGFGQHTRDLSGAVLQVAGQEIAGALERAGDVLGLAFESGRDGGADIRDADLDLVARAGEAVHQLDAAAGHFLDDPLARPTERLRDLLAALLQGTGDPVACAADRGDHPLGGLVEILRHVLVRTR